MEAEIENKINDGTPLSVGEAMWLYQHADMERLSHLSTCIRNRFHPPGQATYLIMAIVNYTNICVAGCDYCAFYKYPHEKGAYLLSYEELRRRIESLMDFGGTLIGFNGGFHPKLTLHDYAELFRKVHTDFPQLTFYEMTVAEFLFYCKKDRIPLAEGAKILKEAGTQWVTGGGAEILTDSFRLKHSPGKFSVSQYYAAQQALLEADLGSTATMVIGFNETLEERFGHLALLREFQESTGRRLPSFLLWTYKPLHNALGGEEISTQEYLRWLAICRLFLHNIPHIRTSVLTRNEDALQGLKFGADDFDLPTEDEVTQKAGATISTNFKKILASAHTHGYTPHLRKAWSPLPSDAPISPSSQKSAPLTH